MAGSVRDTALLPTVLAGWDGLDPRMTPEAPLRQHVKAYHEILDEAIGGCQARGHWNATAAASGLRIGLVKEAWSDPQLSEEVAAVVKQAGQRFAGLGGKVEEVSIPMHAMGSAIYIHRGRRARDGGCVHLRQVTGLPELAHGACHAREAGRAMVRDHEQVSTNCREHTHHRRVLEAEPRPFPSCGGVLKSQYPIWLTQPLFLC